MAKFSEMSQSAQLGIIVVVLVVITGGLYFGVYKNISDKNNESRLKLDAKQKENDKLRPYERNLPELNRTTESLQLQLENLQRIVPDSKEIPQFMHLLEKQAKDSKVWIRRYSSKAVVSREFYTEVPFDLELDGPYYSVLSFFDKVGKSDRIVNIGGLKLYSIKGGEKGAVKGNYGYAPQETVIALCEARTFFSHDSLKASAVEDPKAKKKKK